MVQLTTIVPGYLVSCKTSIRGGVVYAKQDLEDTTTHKRWITDKTIHDPEETERAQKVRNKCSSLVRGVCSLSSFGLLCREDAKWKLDDAVAEARELADTFNKDARFSKITVNVIAGRVADNDVEAAKAIRGEVGELIADMQAGIAALDVAKIRDAASRARSVGKMLSPEAQERVQEAIDTARLVARKIVAAGEQAAQEIDDTLLAKLTRARTEFLDLPDEGEVTTEVQTDQADGRGLDLEPWQDDAVPDYLKPAAMDIDTEGDR
jgi:hypothetical protein